MKLMKSCALLGLCLLQLTACGLQDDQKDRRDRDDDDEVITIKSSEAKNDDGMSNSKRSCKLLDTGCQAMAEEEEPIEEEPMMSSEDGEFTIYHVSQGACGEADDILINCDGFMGDFDPSDEWVGSLCIRENYDVAQCVITHRDEVCKMVDSDWEYESEVFDGCLDAAYSARDCDAFNLQYLSCKGMEYHELPEEHQSEACDEATINIGKCASSYPESMCDYIMAKEEDPDKEFEDYENRFSDCIRGF